MPQLFNREMSHFFIALKIKPSSEILKILRVYLMEDSTTRGEPLSRVIRHYDLPSTVRQGAFWGWFGGADHLMWYTTHF